MRAILLAYHDIGYVCLQELLDQGDEVAAVFTHEDNPNEEIWFRSVKELSRAHGVPTFTPDDINAPEWRERIRSLNPDVLFSFYFRQMVGQEILDIPPLGCLNLHGSLLPQYRGRVPVNWAILNGETETGVTLHYMVAKPDAGDIVAQRRVPIAFEDTALTLYRKLVPAARELFAVALPLLREGRAPRIPQDLSRGSYFGGRRPEDGRIDWSWPAMRIYNLVRAVTHPYPGAFTSLGGRKLFVWQCRPAEGAVRALRWPEEAAGRPGEVVAASPAEGACLVQAGDGLLRLQRVQVDGAEEQAGSLLPVGATLG